jgi:hypothetical protein
LSRRCPVDAVDAALEGHGPTVLEDDGDGCDVVVVTVAERELGGDGFDVTLLHVEAQQVAEDGGPVDAPQEGFAHETAGLGFVESRLGHGEEPDQRARGTGHPFGHVGLEDGVDEGAAGDRFDAPELLGPHPR